MEQIDTNEAFSEKLEAGFEALSQAVLAARIHPHTQDKILERLDEMKSEIGSDAARAFAEANAA